MTEFIDVPVAEVADGDEVRVDGYGVIQGTGFRTVSDISTKWRPVRETFEKDIQMHFGTELAYFRRSSIVACRRRKPEPQPKPGDWRCVNQYGQAQPVGCDYYQYRYSSHCCEWFRTRTGWAKNTRTGQPWVMRDKDPVEIKLYGVCGDVVKELEKCVATFYREHGLDLSLRPYGAVSSESWPDYYKRIGLDVRPADRRKH